MRSQKIYVRNIPADQIEKRKSIKVKPTPVLYFSVLLGALFLFGSRPLKALGLAMITFAIFALSVLPNRTLISFAPTFLGLYNQRDRKEAMMIYYDEIVSWRYDWHNPYDILSVALVDGSTESIEMFSRFLTARRMKEFLPDKEVRNIRNKK